MAFLTVAGENKIAYQQGNSLLFDVTHFVLANITGLGAEPVDRIAAMPDPGDIVDTRPVSRAGYVNANQVVYSLTLDSTIGDYTFNWVGLKDADDVLVAVVHLADPITKTATAGGIEGNNLVRNFLLQYTGLTATTAISAPAETWQIDFTTRLLQIDERERLSNFDIYGQFAAFGDGFKVSLVSGSDYEIAAGVGYVGGIRCEQATSAAINVTGLPKSIWIDASLQGDLTGVEAVFSFTDTAAILTDYTDGLGFDHYVAKIADISAGGVITQRGQYRIPLSNLVVFTSSGTFTVPDNVYKIKAEVWGGGGGGSGGVGATGAGGGYAQKMLDVSPGDLITVTVGVGGAGATYPTVAGSGTTSSFGAHVSATGGAGGGAGQGSGGFGVGGDENLGGQSGSDLADPVQVLETGGASPRGGSGGANTIGNAPGGGGGAGWTTPGSAGARGQINVWY